MRKKSASASKSHSENQHVQSEKIRLDKWLWHARFFKTRSLAAKVVSAGGCRVDGQPVSKPAYLIGPGVVVTFSQADHIRVIKVRATGLRRGPASEAITLYEDLDPPKPRVREDIVLQTPKFDGKGRPSKQDRRAMEQMRRDLLE